MEKIVQYILNLVSLAGHGECPADAPEGIKIQPLSKVKKVIKPWGFELWLSDASATPYAFKIIYLKSGTKTSLQIHKEKTEHNFILAGTANVHYESNDTGTVVYTTLDAGHVIDIRPNAVHRIEALTDIVLIETSSHQLDDVIRLADDYRRPDGKIESEHENG